MNKDFFDEHAARETFERFLFEMDDRIEGLQAAAAARNLTLDLSLESLSELESFIEDTMSRTPTTNHKESLLITAGRYLGEVVRERHGGRQRHDQRRDERERQSRQAVPGDSRRTGVAGGAGVGGARRQHEQGLRGEKSMERTVRSWAIAFKVSNAQHGSNFSYGMCPGLVVGRLRQIPSVRSDFVAEVVPEPCVSVQRLKGLMEAGLYCPHGDQQCPGDLGE